MSTSLIVFIIWALLALKLFGDCWFYRNYYRSNGRYCDPFGVYKEWRLVRKERFKSLFVLTVVLFFVTKGA